MAQLIQGWHDFRGAVDYIRMTARAVQQWLELLEQRGDPYKVLPLSVTERVRRATQMAKDLSLDLDSLEVCIETAGLEDLFQAVGTSEWQSFSKIN